MRQVEVPGVGYVNYPDDWSDEQIREHATQHSQKWLAAEPAPQAAPLPDKTPPTGFLPNLSAGFRSAAGPGNLSKYAAAAASAADVLGLPAARTSLENYSREQRETAAQSPGYKGEFWNLAQDSTDPDSQYPNPLKLLQNSRDWAGSTIGSAAGSTLPPVAGTLAGAGAGLLAGGPVGAGIGGLLGGGLVAHQMGMGDTSSEILEQTGTLEGQGLRAAAWGIPYAVTEMALGPMKLAAQAALRPIIKSAVLTPAVKQGLIKTALKSGAEEGLVAEPLQTMMTLEAAREAKGDPLESVMTMDNGWRVLNAMASGAVGGTALGGAVGAVTNSLGKSPSPEPSTDDPDSSDVEGVPPPLPSIAQDNINPNPYGAGNENTYTMQAGPLGAVSTADPYTQVTPPDYPQEPAFKSPVKVQMPKGQPASLTSADSNLKLARKRAEQLLKQARASKQRAKVNALPAANDASAATPSEPTDTTVKAPAPTPAQKPQDTTLDTPRYSVKPFGKTGEETYGIVDNSRKPRSKGWLIQKGLPSPEVAQSFADQFNGLDNRKPTAPILEAVAPTGQQKTPEVLEPPSVDPNGKGLEKIGDMAGGMRDGAIDSIWKSTQTGKWAIAPEKAGLFEQVVDRLNKSGKLKSREDVANVYDAKINTAQEAADFIKSYPTSNTTPIVEPPKAVRAYHGSPHDFDKFSSDKIGTGEGNQAYGHGLYFAGKKEVAKHYRNKLSPITVVTPEGKPLKAGRLEDVKDVENFLKEKGYDPDPIRTLAIDIYSGHSLNEILDYRLELLADSPESSNTDASINYNRTIVKMIKDMLIDGWKDNREGKLYTVDIKPDVDDFLDLDKPAYDQSKKVRKALRSLGIDTSAPGAANVLTKYLHPIGFNIYKKLSEKLGSDATASSALKEAGIAGNKYLDGASRNKGEGHHNYVVFDDSLVDIETKEMRGEASDKPKAKGFTIHPDSVPKRNQTETAMLKSVFEDLRDELDAAGLPDVALHVVQALKDLDTGKADTRVGGQYWPASNGKFGRIIQVAAMAYGNPKENLRHEIIHAMRDLGVFTPQEWADLEQFAERDWVKKYNVEKRWAGDPRVKEDRWRLLEEAIAEAGREYQTGKFEGSAKQKTLLDKLNKFLEALKNWWEGYGFQTAEDVFDAGFKRAKQRGERAALSKKEMLSHGYMDNAFVKSQADSMPKYLKVDDIAAASEMLLGRPRKIGPVRAGVYSNWVNKFREVIQTARGLSDVNPFFASLYGKVGLRYKTMKSMMDVYSVILHKGILNNNVSQATKNKVFAALEIWDWKKERPEINGPLTVTNDLGNLDFSKKGEEIILRSPEELNALRSVMEAADLFLDQLKHATLRNLGVQDTNLTPSEAKQKYEQLKEERDNTPRSERAGLQPEITRWKKITKELVGFDKLKKQAYLPRIRFGNAGLAVYKDNEDGEKELIHFQTIEGLDSKLKAWARGPKVLETIKALEAQYPAAQGYSVSKEAFPVTYSTIAQLIRDRARGIHNPYNALLDNLPTILTMLNQQQLDKLQDGDIREVHEYLANRLTSGSVAHHMLEAKKILGVDKEIPRVLGQYGLSMASGISKMQTAPMEREAMANIVGTNDVKLIRYATDYLNYMDNPNEEWNRLKSLGFTWNLGFNPASAALNFANIATMYGPYVSAWTTGVAPVTRSLGSAVKTAAKILKHTAGIVGNAKSFDALPNPDLALAITEDLVKKGYTSQGLYNFLSEMLKNGALDHGLSLEQIGAQPEYGSNLPEHKLGKLYQMGARKAATMFRWTEAMARLTSAISLYELMQNPQFIKNFEKSEKDKYVWQEESGGDPTKGIAGKATKENVAEYILKYTFGDYDKSNRPVFMRGIWGVINQFSQYPLMMMETMFQNMKPFSNKQDAKTLAKMLAVAFLLSGMSGFAPGSDDLKRIIEGMYKIGTGGGKLNLEKEMLELMVERAGIDPGLARDIMYGPYRAVPGIENLPFVGSADISKRIALNTVPAIDNMLTMFAGNAQASPVTGPAGIVAKVSDTWDAYHRGTPYALTNMLPTAFHNVSQGMFEWADTGVRNRYNNIVIDPAVDGPLKLTANDYASKIIGFTPQKVSTGRKMVEFQRSISDGTKDMKSHMRSQIMVAFQQQRMAAQRGDDSRYEAATQQIQDYMREVREYDAERPPSEKIGIKPKDLADIRREAIASMGTAFKTAKRVPKDKRPEVNEMRERLFGDVLPPL